MCQICGDSSDESDAENIETVDEMQPLPWDARDWMMHPSVEVGGASGHVREEQYDVLIGWRTAYLIQYDDGEMEHMSYEEVVELSQ